MPVRINEYLLGTPETSLRGLSTLKVLRVDRSTEPSPSWLAGIMYGKNLKYSIIFFCTEKSRKRNFGHFLRKTISNIQR